LRRLGIISSLLILSVAAFGQSPYKHDGSVLLPNPRLTPGAVRIKSKSIVCSTKWGKDERHVTQKMKDEVFRLYGTSQGKGVCAFKTRATQAGRKIKEGCEIDHNISRELGGADVVSNLWAQPYTQHPGAREKDHLENVLHKMVCEGDITLERAQREIAHNWYKAYKRYVVKSDGRLGR
jgi:hypothetical protein